MSQPALVFHNGPIFDGERLLADRFAAFENCKLTQIGQISDLPSGGEKIDLSGDILSLGYVDLQVNGGGGVMFNDAPSVETLRRIAAAHRGLGVRRFLPTLITDTPQITRAAITATIEAVQAGVPGIAGLHLEGPHLSIAKKGAHDGALIRPMEDHDLSALLEAADQLPCLKVTVAPENVTEAQVTALSDAGVLVSLGHTDADFDTCRRYFAAGARFATHLFNAMSQIGSREPGLVGAVLATGNVSAGLISDGVHVHPETMRIARQSKTAPGHIYFVSDSMAVAGTTETSFELGGRKILRREGQLRLEDGTLAGADLDLTTAISVSVGEVGLSLETALASATTIPAALIALRNYRLEAAVTDLDDLIRIKADLSDVHPLVFENEKPSFHPSQ